MNKNLLIIGAGQFGQVTKEIAESMNIFNKIDFLDDSSALAIGKINDYLQFTDNYKYAIVAIGDSTLRKELITKLEKHYVIKKIISPLAYVSKSANIRDGCIIEPMAIVNANSVVGKSSIVCAGAIINHNAIIHDYCHINCGSIIRSNSEISESTKVDYGEII